MDEAEETWRMDARAERVALRLREVVLEVSERQAIDDVSVAELSRLAGISRSTFYKHASSPAALLRRALVDELAQVRARVILRVETDSRDLRELSRSGLADVLDHVAAHESIYRLALSEGGNPELHRLLADHFADAVLTIFRKAFVRAPDNRFIDDLELYAAFVSGAYVEVIAVWLREGSHRSVTSVIEILMSALPDWMLETGTLSE